MDLYAIIKKKKNLKIYLNSNLNSHFMSILLLINYNYLDILI